MYTDLQYNLLFLFKRESPTCSRKYRKTDLGLEEEIRKFKAEAFKMKSEE